MQDQEWSLNWNSSIYWIFLWELPIQNDLHLSTTEKRRNKARYLTWNSIRLKFVRKTSMPNPKSWSTTAWVAPDLLRALAILADITVKRSAVDQEDLKPYWKLEKMDTLLYAINNPIIYKLSKVFTNHTKKTNRVVVFSCRTFPNILKYRDHQWNLPTIWKTRILIEEFS